MNLIRCDQCLREIPAYAGRLELTSAGDAHAHGDWRGEAHFCSLPCLAGWAGEHDPERPLARRRARCGFKHPEHGPCSLPSGHAGPCAPEGAATV